MLSRNKELIDLILLYLPCKSIIDLAYTCKDIYAYISRAKKKLCLYHNKVYDPKLMFEYHHIPCQLDFYSTNKKMLSKKPWKIHFFDDVVDKIDIIKKYDIDLDDLSIDIFCQCAETKQHAQDVRYILSAIPFHILWNMIYKTNFAQIKQKHMQCLLSIFNKFSAKKKISATIIANVYRYISEELATILLSDIEKTVELSDCIYFTNRQYVFLSSHCKIIKHCLLEIDLSRKINFAILYTNLDKDHRIHIILELGNKIRKLSSLISLLSEYDNASISENIYYYLYSHVFDRDFYTIFFSFRQLKAPHFITILSYAVRSYTLNYEFLTNLVAATEITIEQIAEILINGFCFDQLFDMFDLFPAIKDKKIMISNDHHCTYKDTLNQVLFLIRMEHHCILSSFMKKYSSFSSLNKKKFATKLLKEANLPIDVMAFLLIELYS